MIHILLATEDSALRQHAKTFYLASLFLGKKTASQVERLYAFCRAVDDIADKTEDKQLAKQTLLAWKTQLCSGHASSAQVLDLLDLAAETQLSLADLSLLLDGVMSDLDPVHLQNQGELIGYCFLVAGTVGLLMCQLLGASSNTARKFAIDLGIAMQLTNILRDVAEDAGLGRQYLPQAWLPDDLALLHHPEFKQGQRAKKAFETLYLLAEDYYQSGLQGLRYLPLRHRFAVLVAARLYQEIGHQAKARDFEVWDKRVVVGQARKLCLLGRVALRFVSALFSEKKLMVHDERLHRPLTAWRHHL